MIRNKRKIKKIIKKNNLLNVKICIFSFLSHINNMIKIE